MEASSQEIGVIILVAALAIIFAFSNGFRDSSSIVATVVSTRALSPEKAFSLCALFEFLGAVFIGSAIIGTIGNGVISGQAVMASKFDVLMVLCTAIGAAIVWGILSWWWAIPTSNNQALFAGLVGSSAAVWGFDQLNSVTILLVISVLVFSPLIGFLVSTLVTSFIRWAGEWMTPQVKYIVEKLHIFSCLLVSGAHGSNDGQMISGVLVMGFGLLGGVLPALKVGPFESLTVIRILVALSLASGVLLGGQRILRKLGMQFYRIKPSEGLGAEMSSAITILSCAMTGFPASTTQVITGSIIGAGVAKNPKAVRWGIAKEIVLSWVFTIPVVGLMGFTLCKILKGI